MPKKKILTCCLCQLWIKTVLDTIYPSQSPNNGYFHQEIFGMPLVLSFAYVIVIWANNIIVWADKWIIYVLNNFMNTIILQIVLKQ